MMQGIEYSKDPKNFYVRYNAPRRDYSDLRTEFNNDALSISQEHGPVYIGFSSGVDSQVIARCFLDMKLDAEFVFLHCVGYNDLEFQRVKECEKFFGIKVKILEIHLEQFKDQWIERSKEELVKSMHNYPFEWLSQQLPEPWPFVMQGATEPALVGKRAENVCVYHNFYEFMEIRVRMMSQYRKIIDFPYSPESVASYYTDETVKTFCNTIQYLHENGVSKLMPEAYPGERFTQYFNAYAKGFVKGRHFNKEILWHGKLNGAEEYPSWFESLYHVSKTKVSVPYWDLVDFLENQRNCYRDFSDWNLLQK